jgi:hypothetical protein
MSTMDISEVRRRVRATIEHAQKAAADRRESRDKASRAFETFLETTAIPLVRQVANALRADAYLFTVSTPSGSVRLTSERNPQDYIEILLDPGDDVAGTGSQGPRVVGHSSRGRGRRVMESERVVGSGDPDVIGEAELLAFLMKELAPLVER